MADGFDPYHVWLGISPGEQPANYYRLLGIPLFEANPEVIDSAADRQTAHLRTFQGGKHGELTQRLLNEVAAARVRLLNLQQKGAYDQKLRDRAAAPLATASALPANAASTNRSPPRRSPAAKGPQAPISATPAPAPQAEWDELLGGGEGGRSPAMPKSPARGRTTVQGIRRLAPLAIVGAFALIAAGAGIFASRSSPPTALAFSWPTADRAGVTLTVDGVPVAIPTHGEWEYHCRPGQRHVVGDRPAFKPFDKMVAVEDGQRQTVDVEWNAKAMLIVSWPIAERHGAELKIDGRVHTPGEPAAFEIAVEPGQHVIRVERPRSEAFEKTVTVESDQRRIVAVTEAASTLVIDWPAGERRGARLTIDDQIRSPSSNGPVEIVLKPGDHVVRITRPGFRPFEQLVNLPSAGNARLVPAWTPQEPVSTAGTAAGDLVRSDDHAVQAGISNPTLIGTTAGQARDVPTATTKDVSPLPEQKQAVPTVAEQDKIGKELDMLYKPANGTTKPQIDANGLYNMADKPGTLPAERYMLLVKGAELAVRSGDLSLAFQGLDTAAADFEFDPIEAKQKLLAKFVLTATTADQLDAITMAAEPLIDDAITADRYETAMALAATAGKAIAKRPGDLQLHRQTEDRLNHRRQEIRALEPLFAIAHKAQTALNADPTNAEANLALGRWVCLTKGDWKTGLPRLVLGGDERLKKLATQELRPPADSAEQLRLADAWWDFAKSETPLTREHVRQHAGQWYRAALPGIDSALKRVPIEARLKEVGKPEKSNRIPLGQWVDLLPIVDLTKHVIAGNWTRRGSDVIVEPLDGSRIRFPIVLRGSYDMEVNFTRTIGNCDITTNVPVGSHHGSVNLSGFAGGASGLDGLDGRRIDSRDNPISVRPGGLENFHRYRTLIRVRYLGENRATIDVYLDGKPYFPHWEGNPASLDGGPSDASTVGKGTDPEFGVWDSGATLHSLRLLMLSGEAVPAIN